MRASPRWRGGEDETGEPLGKALQVHTRQSLSQRPLRATSLVPAPGSSSPPRSVPARPGASQSVRASASERAGDSSRLVHVVYHICVNTPKRAKHPPRPPWLHPRTGMGTAANQCSLAPLPLSGLTSCPSRLSALRLLVALWKGNWLQPSVGFWVFRMLLSPVAGWSLLCVRQHRCN